MTGMDRFSILETKDGIPHARETVPASHMLACGAATMTVALSWVAFLPNTLLRRKGIPLAHSNHFRRRATAICDSLLIKTKQKSSLYQIFPQFLSGSVSMEIGGC